MKNYLVDLNDILDKIASLKPISEESLDTISYVFQKKARTNDVKYFEKILGPGGEGAYGDLSKEEEKKIEKFSKIRFTSAHNLPNGCFIVFPEAHGTEVSMNHGIVFKLNNKATMIVSNDGRFVILENSEPFICLKVDNQSFRLNTIPIKALDKDDKFFVINGNEAQSPLKVISNTTMSYLLDEWDYPVFSPKSKDNRHSIGHLIELTSADPTSKSDNTPARKIKRIRTLEDANFENMSKDEYVLKKSNQFCIPIDIVERSCRFGYKEEEFVVADENFKVFKLTGPLTGYIKSQQEFELVKNANDAGYDIDDIEKVAFSQNKITLVCTDRKNNRFNLSIDYRDTDSRFLQGRNLRFNNITKAKAKAILRILGYQGAKLSECIFKAKNEPRCIVPVPASCTMEDIKRLDGGEMTNTSKQAVKDALNEYANPYTIAKAVGIATTAGLLLNAGTAIAPTVAGSGAAVAGTRILSKILKNAENASIGLEKVASDESSDIILDYAKAATIAHNYLEKVAEVINDDKNLYPGLKDITLEVLKAKPVYEKIAYELTGYKVNQRLQGKEIINPSVIGNAIDSLDNLVKVASEINKTMDLEKLSFVKRK